MTIHDSSRLGFAALVIAALGGSAGARATYVPPISVVVTEYATYRTVTAYVSAVLASPAPNVAVTCTSQPPRKVDGVSYPGSSSCYVTAENGGIYFCNSATAPNVSLSKASYVYFSIRKSDGFCTQMQVSDSTLMDPGF